MKINRYMKNPIVIHGWEVGDPENIIGVCEEINIDDKTINLTIRFDVDFKFDAFKYKIEIATIDKGKELISIHIIDRKKDLNYYEIIDTGVKVSIPNFDEEGN